MLKNYKNYKIKQHKNDGYVKNFVKALKKIKYIKKYDIFVIFFIKQSFFAF